MSLSSDQPRADPKDDLFGHAPFAEQLAKSISRYTAESGLVLALHGPWGSGKSTVLGYVRHYLAAQVSAKDLVIVDFNPWWFSGRDDLAHAFLRQLQAVLPSKSEKLKNVASLLGDFAEGVGGLIDLAGLTGGAGASFGKLIGRLTKSKPKDVPALKAQIADGLRTAKVRILVLIDDIDRLDNSEVRQLLTVVKALADFPYVTYLLAFDHDVAARAIESESHLPGDRYLEKIVQVPFHLPAVDRVALRNAVFSRLNEVLAESDGTAFDRDYWGAVFLGGLDPLFQVPRDIVRLMNTLSVTYPAVAGEVNPVDFVAIESIRVFLPSLYDRLRANPEKFVGHAGDRQRGEADRAFHDKWVSEIDEQWQPAARTLIERLFPKVGRGGYGADWLSEWRRDLRVCHPDVFPVYFRLSLPSGAVGRAEIMALVDSLANPSEFKQTLLDARNQKRIDGIPRVRALLERFADHVEKDIPDAHVAPAIEALIDVGDDLIEPENALARFEPGTTWRVTAPLHTLLKRIPKDHRRELFERAIQSSRGVVISMELLSELEGDGGPTGHAGESPLVTAEELKMLQQTWIQRARLAFEAVIANRSFRSVLDAWRHWGNPAEVQRRCEEFVAADASLLLFVRAFLAHVRITSSRNVRLRPRLDPAWLEPFIDVEAAAKRLLRLLDQGGVPEAFRVSVRQFLKERDIRAAGKDPNGRDLLDDAE